MKGEPANILAAEPGLDYLNMLQLRRAIQENAKKLQSEHPLPDAEAESDELFQNAGKKDENTLINSIRLAAEPTNGGDAGPTPTIDRRCSASLDGKVVK